MDTKTRTYEEIITLQDKAIEALTQANAALVMALEALKKARAEHGLPLQFPGFQTLGQGYQGQWGQVGNSAPYIGPAHVPYTVPAEGIQWTSTVTATGAQMADKVVAANNLVLQANSQKNLAQDYIAAYQASVKEQDAFPKMGGCL